MDFKNKIALVTGGSSGIGQAICIALANEGCEVIFTYNTNKKGADETLAKLGSKGIKFKVNVEDEKDIDSLFKFISSEFGKLDILVNNAGKNTKGEPFDTEIWRSLFEIDLMPVVLFSKKSVELMKDGGKILNTSSVYAEGKPAWKGLSAYSAMKAATNNYTQTLAKNLAPRILVNAIAPGYVRTPLWGERTEEEFEENGKQQLIERMIDPLEIAQMAVAIIKNDAMTGEIVVVDGGISLKTV